jgi:hypothetical protein
MESPVKNLVTMKGPVVKVGEELMLLIPLENGGAELIECLKGIGEVDGEFLKVEIPESLAELLQIGEGDLVCVHNSGGTFHIQPVRREYVN